MSLKFVRKEFRVLTDDGKMHVIQSGLQEIPPELADHWYVKANVEAPPRPQAEIDADEKAAAEARVAEEKAAAEKAAAEQAAAEKKAADEKAAADKAAAAAAKK